MFTMTPGLIEGVLLLGGSLTTGAAWVAANRAARVKYAQELTQRLEAERADAHHLCFSTLEALAYALEAYDPDSLGNLDCVLACVTALAKPLMLSEAEASALRAAALLHNIGRLGIPEHILHKVGALTPEELEKLRAYPLLGARILASIPFPWDVVPIVRHQAEWWDGTGHPDGIAGEAIPRGARILAVARAYSAGVRTRAYRESLAPQEVLASVEQRAGTQFDPAVVAALRALAEQELPTAGHLQEHGRPARDPLLDIVAARQETQSLYRLTQALSGTLHLEALCDTLLAAVQEIVPCAACALFLPDNMEETLHAHAALGVNARHLLGSQARIGTYLTGRAFSRREVMRASFLPDDLMLRDVSETWTPFRSTLIVPLLLHGQALGVLNLYAEEPDAFGNDALRVLRLIATQTARALDNARRFAAVQETAYTDALTGLRNARYLREFLEREINRADREQAQLAVLNIDLDNFKPINDRFGHAVGDEALRDVADILNAHIRSYDLAARYAGDEFVVVLTRSGRMAAEVVATKLQLAVARHGQNLATRDVECPQLGISIGIALYPDDATDLQGLLCTSDAAMYRNKTSRRAGRDDARHGRQAA